MPELADYLLAWFVWNVLGPLLLAVTVVLVFVALPVGLVYFADWQRKRRG